MRTSNRAAPLATALLLLSMCGGDGWRELGSIDELREAFNRDAGKHRIVLLLSPT